MIYFSQNDHGFLKRRRQVQTTIKLGCKAMVRVRHVVAFPEYQVNNI